MPDITVDAKLIAACGLYCGACGKYLQGTCKGCGENTKATWCKPRACCKKNQYRSCADCKQFATAGECKDYDNIISKIFGLIFRSDRKACVAMIKAKGYNEFAKYMAEHKLQSIKK
jgi:hypothetical protein